MYTECMYVYLQYVYWATRKYLIHVTHKYFIYTIINKISSDSQMCGFLVYLIQI